MLQLDWPSIADWAYASIFCCGWPVSKLRPVLDSSDQTTWGMYFGFFRKISKWACLVIVDVFGGFSGNSMILRYWRHVSEFAYYECITILYLRVIKLLKKTFVRTSYCLYLGVQSGGDRHRGERLRVSVRSTMFKSLLRLPDSRPFLFDDQEWRPHLEGLCV